MREMNTAKEIDAIVVEKDDHIVAAVRKILEGRGYRVTPVWRRQDAVQILKEGHSALVIAGEAEDSDSPFQIMKEVVMASPMTSLILITDLPKEEVEDTAEGYGILGHVGRSVGSGEMIPLLESFESILGSF
jgi:DNA-binding response OmpR family regulator